MKETEIEESLICSIFLILFHIALDVYKYVSFGRGVMMKSCLCPRLENVNKSWIAMGLLNFMILKVSFAQW